MHMEVIARFPKEWEGEIDDRAKLQYLNCNLHVVNPDEDEIMTSCFFNGSSTVYTIIFHVSLKLQYLCM